MKIDWIRMEYVVDPEMFRGGPTPEEKALHCLFQEPPIPEKAVPLESLLPGFTIRVYINDQLGWNELCDFEELGKMLQPGSGTFRPFVTRCSCPDCETGIDKIHSINTGEWIDWTTLFPHGHPTGCGGSVACGSCPKRDWTLCNFHEQREVKRYRFSAGQFRDEVLALARTVRLIDSCGEALLGGPLLPEKEEPVFREVLENREDALFLRLNWSDCQIRKKAIEQLLQTDFSFLKNPFSFAAYAAGKTTGHGERNEPSAGQTAGSSVHHRHG